MRIGKCGKEMVGQTQDIAHRTWIHKLCSRSVCIRSSNERNNHGVLGVHVDDVIGGADETFGRIMTAVRKGFDIGTWDVGNFRYKGRQISKMPNGEIVFDMEQYKHELEQIKMSKADKTKLERILNSKERTQFRGGVGSLGWFVDHFCPQLSSQLAELRRKQSSPTVQDLLRLNKVIRTARVRSRSEEVFPVEHLRFMGVHDAAHANHEGCASQQVHLIFAVHASITNCRVLVSVLSWQSKKIKRVVSAAVWLQRHAVCRPARSILIGCARCGNR